jgi:predicted RNase H-like HicB family nuclease
MRQLTAIIEREDDVYVALCPELSGREVCESLKAQGFAAVRQRGSRSLE